MTADDLSTWEYQYWLSEVDRAVNAMTRGDHLDDLSPWDGRPSFVAGLDPESAAFEAALNDVLLRFFLGQYRPDEVT